jgi:hypothetical protein
MAKTRKRTGPTRNDTESLVPQEDRVGAEGSKTKHKHMSDVTVWRRHVEERHQFLELCCRSWRAHFQAHPSGEQTTVLASIEEIEKRIPILLSTDLADADAQHDSIEKCLILNGKLASYAGVPSDDCKRFTKLIVRDWRLDAPLLEALAESKWLDAKEPRAYLGRVARSHRAGLGGELPRKSDALYGGERIKGPLSPGPACRVLMRNGKWLVPIAERPKLVPPRDASGTHPRLSPVQIRRLKPPPRPEELAFGYIRPYGVLSLEGVDEHYKAEEVVNLPSDLLLHYATNTDISEYTHRSGARIKAASDAIKQDDDLNTLACNKKGNPDSSWEQIRKQLGWTAARMNRTRERARQLGRKFPQNKCSLGKECSRKRGQLSGVPGGDPDPPGHGMYWERLGNGVRIRQLIPVRSKLALSPVGRIRLMERDFSDISKLKWIQGMEAMVMGMGYVPRMADFDYPPSGGNLDPDVNGLQAILEEMANRNGHRPVGELDVAIKTAKILANDKAWVKSKWDARELYADILTRHIDTYLYETKQSLAKTRNRTLHI